MALFYPNLYEQHRLQVDGSYKQNDLHNRTNNPTISVAIQDVCKYLTHAYVPGQASAS